MQVNRNSISLLHLIVIWTQYPRFTTVNNNKQKKKTKWNFVTVIIAKEKEAEAKYEALELQMNIVKKFAAQLSHDEVRDALFRQASVVIMMYSLTNIQTLLIMDFILVIGLEETRQVLLWPMWLICLQL